MRKRNWSCGSGGAADVQRLEPRRLLSFTPVGGETAATLPTPVEEFDLAVAGDGTHIVAGAHLSGGGTATISAVRYSAAGAQLGDVLTIDSFTEVEFLSIEVVSVSADADGDAVVAYFVQGDVYLKRISRTGEVGPRVTVDLEGGSPEVSMDAGGGFFLATVASLSEDEHVVHMQAFDASGAPRAAAFEAVHLSSPFSSLNSLDIDARPDGSGAVFAYFQDTGDSISQIVAAGRVSTTARLGDFSFVGSTSELPSVAALPDGSFLVGYDARPDHHDSSTSNRRALVQRFNADGSAAGAPIELGAAAGGAAGSHTVALDAMPDGGFVATFVRSTLNDGELTATNTLYASRYLSGVGDAIDPSGAVALDAKVTGASVQTGPTIGVIFDAQEAFTPVIGADATGGAVVAYAEDDVVFIRGLASSAEPSDSVLADGVLTVPGTFAADAIGVAPDGANIVVTRGAKVESFAAADVDAIVIDGGNGDDTIINDTAVPSTILGGAGNDKIVGGFGNDSLAGGDGKDKLLGRYGKDLLAGNAGNDSLEGGLGADGLRGHGGRDRLYGNGGNDRLFGGANGDWLYGQNGSDALFGNGGNDRLYDDYAGGVDMLHGGNGDDLLVSQDSLADQLFGGRGDDTSVDDPEEDDVVEVEVRADG